MLDRRIPTNPRPLASGLSPNGSTEQEEIEAPLEQMNCEVKVQEH